jgi:hypothetical protein
VAPAVAERGGALTDVQIKQDECDQHHKRDKEEERRPVLVEHRRIPLDVRSGHGRYLPRGGGRGVLSMGQVRGKRNVCVTEHHGAEEQMPSTFEFEFEFRPCAHVTVCQQPHHVRSVAVACACDQQYEQRASHIVEVWKEVKPCQLGARHIKVGFAVGLGVGDRPSGVVVARSAGSAGGVVDTAGKDNGICLKSYTISKR